MAAIDLSTASRENPSTDGIFEVPFVAGHTLGMVLKANGVVSAAVGDTLGGVIVRVGDAAGAKTIVMFRGILEGVSGAGAAANAQAWSVGDGTLTDTKPAGAAGTVITRIGVMPTTTRMIVNVQQYEKGA